jgi:uncharacterized small protein (DUF1192 family)
MDDNLPKERPDWALAKIGKEDLSTLSADDLRERIQSMTDEIARCEREIEARGNTRSAAEKLFKF